MKSSSLVSCPLKTFFCIINILLHGINFLSLIPYPLHNFGSHMANHMVGVPEPTALVQEQEPIRLFPLHPSIYTFIYTFIHSSFTQSFNNYTMSDSGLGGKEHLPCIKYLTSMITIGTFSKKPWN